MAEHVSTNKELQAQVVKGRETLQAALSAKEELSRKAQASQKVAQETRRMTADDLTELEQVGAADYRLFRYIYVNYVVLSLG